MCGWPEKSSLGREMVSMASEEALRVSPLSCLLEFAANNDVIGFKQAIECGVEVDKPDYWYCRQNGTKRMVQEQRTAVMVASLYGSYEVLDYILNHYYLGSTTRDINQRCGTDATTALHCAASGGSEHGVEIITLLVCFGADPMVVDARGQRPADVIWVSPRNAYMKASLEERLILKSSNRFEESYLPSLESIESVYEDVLGLEEGLIKPIGIMSSLSSSLSSVSSSPSSSPPNGVRSREYPIDPSLPDIKNGIYTTDEFRMFSFKVRPCSRAYSHDWTECPFVHPGENARRRDPRRYHYSCVPCPDFRKSACKRGDACEYAHGVFECWLHPAQYRTRLCKDGTSCTRRVCFFAHITQELRPLYTSSTLPSPRGGSIDSPLSPTSIFTQTSFLSTPPRSPSQSANTVTATNNIPSLHLPSTGLQLSRLRTNSSACNMTDYPDFDTQLLYDFSTQMLSSPGGSQNLGPPTADPATNLDGFFTSEMLSSTLHLQNQLQAQMNSPSNHHRKLLESSPFVLASSPHSRHLDINYSSTLTPPISPSVAVARGNFALYEERSHSSRDLRSSGGSPLSDWGSPTGKPEWGVNVNDLSKFRKSASFGFSKTSDTGAPIIRSQVRSLDHPPTAGNNNRDQEVMDHSVLGSWIEQMNLDQIVA